MTATHIFDPTGVSVALGKELGRGGEGAVYDIQGRQDSVAKVYLNPPSFAHAEKLATMAGMAEPNLLRLAAWPTSTLHGPSGSVVGFVMPKVAGHSPVFKLYGPKLRLQEFPKADWRFLIHAATNTARAFSTVHTAGLVIGDVNHGNLVVGQDATVRLIDCDSFQVSKGSRTWFCEVGVGTHQPPEMQAVASYAGITRTLNHDNFGLAVIIFQLLCMARHPFMGRFLSSGDPPTIEEAIARSQYAYSREQRRTMMAPPPGSLPIEALTPDLRDLFEAAFAPSARNRPSGDRWVTALQQLGGSLRECSRNQAHRYFSGFPQCPWCQIETASGTPLFPVVFIGKPGTAIGMAALWQEVSRITEPPPLPPLPDPDRTQLPPSPALLAAAKNGRKLAMSAYTSIGAAAFFVMALAPVAVSWLILIAIGSLTAIIMKTSKAIGPDDRQLEDVRQDLSSLRAAWQVPSSNFGQLRRDLDALKARYDELPTVRAKRLQQLSEQRRQNQFQDHLDRFLISSAKIPGIGRAKIATLGSYGIDTAADIERTRVLSIPGFGAATAQKLLLWRQTHERTFSFNPDRAISPSEIVALERDITMQRSQLEQDVAAGLGRLKAAVTAATARRQSLESRAAELLPRYAQAAADARVRPTSPTVHKRLLALSATSVGITLLSLIPNATPQARPTVLPQASLLPAEKAPIILSVQPPPAAPVLPPVATQEPVNNPTSAARVDTRHVFTRQAANIRLAPDNTSPVVRTITQGTALTIYVRRNGWVQVGDDTPWGWIYSGLLTEAP